MLYVPRADNQDRPFGDELWAALEEDLFEFGRFSRVEGVSGAWRSQGKTYHDTSRQYVVSLNSWTQLDAWLQVAQRARTRFKQQAIYIEVAGVPEVIG